MAFGDTPKFILITILILLIVGVGGVASFRMHWISIPFAALILLALAAFSVTGPGLYCIGVTCRIIFRRNE